jgi:hypothetical protein
MGCRGTITKTLMCWALVQIIYFERKIDTTVLNKYSKWVSLKLHAIKIQETKFSGKFQIKKPTRACTNMYIYFIVNCVSCYMFQPPVMAIVREVFFERYVT